MDILIKTNSDQHTYLVPDSVVQLVTEAVRGAAATDARWRGNAKTIVELFWGPLPVDEEDRESHFEKLRAGPNGDGSAYRALDTLLRNVHPEALVLRQLNDELPKHPEMNEERRELMTKRAQVAGRIRVMAAMARGRILRYYLADFAPHKAIKARSRDVRSAVSTLVGRLQRIADNPEKNPEEASLALMVITMLQGVLQPPAETGPSVALRKRIQQTAMEHAEA